VARAQEKYADLILETIPPGVRTILDVGCGSGRFMQVLTERGYGVDGVSPGPMMAAQARKRLAEGQILHECRFEDLATERRYDLVLFSESFQYIKVDDALRNSLQLLNPAGSLLIADYFRRDNSPSPLGGGHLLATFEESISKLPLQKLVDLDITKQTAPNLDLAGDLVNEVARPVIGLVVDLVRANHPVILKAVLWIYRKKIARAQMRYQGDARSGATFARYKTYRVMVYRKSL
jgi:SAM-dependent methyltransferase